MEFVGFGNDNDDSEYELALTPTFRMNFISPNQFLLVAGNLEDARVVEGLHLVPFDIVERIEGGLVIRCEVTFYSDDGNFQCNIVTLGGQFRTSQDIYGDRSTFERFLNWLWKSENSQEKKDERQIREAIQGITRRRNELSALLENLLFQKPLNVKTLLSTQHVDAISRFNAVVSFDTPNYYYVLDATDVQIESAVDKYPILSLDSLLGLLQTPNNRNPYTRNEISRIRKIKFILRKPTELEQFGPPKVGLKRSRSIAGGKSGGKSKKSRRSRRPTRK